MMKYHILQHNPDRRLQKRLEAFETQFHYPLGEENWFSIDHGPHYLNFYLAMGPATCIVAEDEEGVQGTLCAAMRSLYTPLPKSFQKIGYLGDLKVAPLYQGQGLSYRLLHEMAPHFLEPNLPLMGIVMDGTPLTPIHYTGKKGVQTFYPLQKMVILQIQTSTYPVQNFLQAPITEECAFNLYNQLNPARYFLPHQISLRAQGGSQWVHLNDNACGLLENTRLAKRLYMKNHLEIKNAHLSYFAYDAPNSAVALLKQALHKAHHADFNALFLALTENKYQNLKSSLEHLPVLSIAYATIYGTEHLKSCNFEINTAEI